MIALLPKLPKLLKLSKLPILALIPSLRKKTKHFFSLTQPVKMGWLLCIVKQVITD